MAKQEEKAFKEVEPELKPKKGQVVVRSTACCPQHVPGIGTVLAHEEFVVSKEQGQELAKGLFELVK
jgi:hypothetical protein